MAKPKNPLVVVAVILVAAAGVGLAGWAGIAKAGKKDAERRRSAFQNPHGEGEGGRAVGIEGATVPGFRFDRMDGETMGLEDLAGKVWVADFIFTHCAGTCPRMTSMMKILQEATADLPELQLVSFSVDPDRDTPQALQEYAKEYGADTRRWHFLRGDQKAVNRLAAEGFKLGDPENPLNHSQRFALVDGRGVIRGYYDGATENRALDVERLEKDARALIAAGAR